MFRLLSHYNRFLNDIVVFQLYKTSSIRLVDKTFLSSCDLCERGIVYAQRSRICAVGGFIHSSPRRRQLNVVTKDKILFCCSIVNVKLGQKAEQRYCC